MTVSRIELKTMFLTSAAAIGVFIVAPGIAAAQAAPAQAGDTAPQAKDDGAALEDIVVTGERNNRFGTDVVQAGSFRGAKTLDTPLTISVIPSAVLQSQQAIDLIDAVRNTAGVSSSSVGPVAYNNVTIRGIAVDTRSNFKLDGALNILSSIAFPLEDKDRVEVLKGASALYYGFSNPSGIVNLTMKRPTPEFMLYENTFFDSNGGIGQHIDVGGTFGKFGARINGVYARVDPGIRYSEGRRYLISGAFDYKPTDNLTFTVDVEDFARRVIEPSSFRYTSLPKSTVADPYPKVALPSLDQLDPRENFSAPWTTNNASEINYLGKVNYKISRAWNISAFYGQSRIHRIRYNPTFNPTNLVTGAGVLTLSPQDSVFKNVNYAVELAGVIKFGNIRNEILVGASRGVKDATTPVATRATFAQNYLNPVFIPFQALPFNHVADTTRIDDIGFYAFDRLSFNDVVQVLGGVRKSDYTESNQTQNQTTFRATPLSYSVGTVIKPVKWVSLYATYIEGLESTPAAPTTALNAQQQLPPTTSRQKEAGIKIEPMKGLLFQAAYFDIKRGSTFVNASNVYVQDGEARYRGTEFSLTGNVTQDLAVFASLTFLDAKYASGASTVVTATGLAPTAATPGNTQITASNVGLRVEGTPNNTWSLATEYTLSWLTEGLKISGGAYHTGSQAFNALNQAFADPYTTFDIGASYAFTIDDHRLVARVNGQNITGERYWASTGAATLSQNVPPTVKFSLSMAL